MARGYIGYYLEYQERAERFRRTDPRELVYQNRVLIPFLEELFRGDNQRLGENERIDVVDVSTQYQRSEGQDYAKYRSLEEGASPPDLLIARNWRLLNRGRTDIDYLATIEVKSPGLKESIYDKSPDEVRAYLNAGSRAEDIGRQLRFHLEACPAVILTDCLRWQFFAPAPPKAELKPWLDIPLWDNDRKKWRTEAWKDLCRELRKIAGLAGE